ncbi:hypothetical protein LXL04_032801 [Taraxacum kok-saghyz]
MIFFITCPIPIIPSAISLYMMKNEFAHLFVFIEINRKGYAGLSPLDERGFGSITLDSGSKGDNPLGPKGRILWLGREVELYQRIGSSFLWLDIATKTGRNGSSIARSSFLDVMFAFKVANWSLISENSSDLVEDELLVFAFLFARSLPMGKSVIGEGGGRHLGRHCKGRPEEWASERC